MPENRDAGAGAGAGGIRLTPPGMRVPPAARAIRAQMATWPARDEKWPIGPNWCSAAQLPFYSFLFFFYLFFSFLYL
jgi:hypothetical protein